MRFLLCIYPKGTGLEVWKIYNPASAESWETPDAFRTKRGAGSGAERRSLERQTTPSVVFQANSGLQGL